MKIVPLTHDYNLTTFDCVDSDLNEFLLEDAKHLLYNPNFNYTEFGTIRNMAGSNNFVLSTKTWIERTHAIGIVAKAGRYGGTYGELERSLHQ